MAQAAILRSDRPHLTCALHDRLAPIRYTLKRQSLSSANRIFMTSLRASGILVARQPDSVLPASVLAYDTGDQGVPADPLRSANTVSKRISGC